MISQVPKSSKNLTSGTLEDWEIGVCGGTYKLNGNRITLTADGTSEVLGLVITNKKNSMICYGPKEYNVAVRSKNKISESEILLQTEFRNYANRKGIAFTSGSNIWGYTWNSAKNMRD